MRTGFGTSMTLLLTTVLTTVGCGEHGTAIKAPSELTATALEGGAHLKWKDNSNDEASFMIERKVGGAEWRVLMEVAANMTQYHDGPLMAGTTYRYRVMAMGKAGHSDGSGYSNEVTFVGQAAGAPTADGGTGGPGDSAALDLRDSATEAAGVDSGGTGVHDMGSADHTPPGGGGADGGHHM